MAHKDRAAQFAPFAAVVGHESAVKEAARYTEKRRVLDEMQKAFVDEALHLIEASFPETTDLEVVYFVADKQKNGGRYLRIRGSIIKIDGLNRRIVMADGTCISIDDIYDIKGLYYLNE
jgi:hypothetical protein